jgi:hypothetical protein
VTVGYDDDERSGLASIVEGLIEQNLARDPARGRLLRPAIVTIAARDADVSITIVTAPGQVDISDGLTHGAHVAITAETSRLLALTAAPLRFGLPDAFDARGRAVIADVVTRRVRIRGLIRHPRRLARLSALLSVA